MLDSFCLTQVVTEPTHTSSNGNQTLIDLALLSDVSQLIECNNVLPLSNSDHSSIELKLKAWNSRPPPINQKRWVWNHEDADFDKTCELIDSVDWDSILCDDKNSSLSMWQQKCISIMEECVPHPTVYSTGFAPTCLIEDKRSYWMVVHLLVVMLCQAYHRVLCWAHYCSCFT